MSGAEQDSAVLWLLRWLCFCSALHSSRTTTMHRSSGVIHLHDGSPVYGQEVYGKNNKPVTEFLGIPFAEPPIGARRFRRPEPKRPWRTALNATQLPNACIQSPDTYFGDFTGSSMWNPNVPTSEDCLYLNIYVPGKVDPRARLPVMVWIYGGGFWSGCSTLAVYDGKILASEEQVIIVSMNYRVSLFGFLYLGRDDAPGNVGLWDQLLALKWVKANIERFGGRADEVTLFGESAGAASVSMHVLSPRSAPYFRRAILQSGSATAPWAIKSREVALSRPVSLCEAMKCGNMSVRDHPDTWDLDKVMQCLLDAPAELLRDNEWAPVMEFADFPWVPVIDGDFLVELPTTSLKTGNFKKTELLAGSNRDEALYFIVYQLQDVFIKEDFFMKTNFIEKRDKWMHSALELLPRSIRGSLPLRNAVFHEYEPFDLPVSPAQWMDSLDKMLGDLQFTCSVNEFALSHAYHGGASYYYYFTHRASQQTWPEWMGVLHGYEINFIFGEPLNPDFQYSEEEQELSRRFMRYWANFARTGDPNKNIDETYTPELWPLYMQSSMQYVNLTVESAYGKDGVGRTGTGPRRKQCAFWKQLLPSLMSAVADYSDAYVRWKQQFDRWQNEYIVDWQFQFEQYKRYQGYRRADESYNLVTTPLPAIAAQLTKSSERLMLATLSSVAAMALMLRRPSNID